MKYVGASQPSFACATNLIHGLLTSVKHWSCPLRVYLQAAKNTSMAMRVADNCDGTIMAVLKLQMHFQAAVQAQTGVRAKSGKSTAVVQAQTGVRAKSGKSTAVVPALFVVHDHDALHIDVLLLHIIAHPDRCPSCSSTPDRCGRCCDIFMFLN